MIFCTAICANHLAKAMTMAKSLKEHMENSKLIVCLLELEMIDEAKNFPYFDEVILPKNLNIPDFFQFIFRHSIYEAVCAIKAPLLEHSMLNNKSENKFVYIDSDVMIYNSFNEVDHLLNNNSIIITPHHIEPLDDIDAIIKIEVNQLRVGSYNMGFLALSKSQEAIKFLKWWKERIYHFCYVDINKGLFLDQKWMDLAPGLFDVFILKHPGYNIGNWNLSKRHFKTEAGVYLVNGEELKFIHFSGLGTWFDQYLEEYVGDKSNLIYTLFGDYKNKLEEYGNNKYNFRPWSFDYFWSGEYIKEETRNYFRNNINKFNHKNPYELSNKYILNFKRKFMLGKKSY